MVVVVVEDSIEYFKKLPVVDKIKLEEQVARYIAAQNIIDSIMEPTEFEKKLSKKIEEYFKENA